MREDQHERRTTTPRNKEIIPEKGESPIGIMNLITGSSNTGKTNNKRPAKLSSAGGWVILSDDKNKLSKEAITIGPKDNEVKQPHTDPLVMSVQINWHTVRWVLIDIGNSVNLITKEVMEKLKHIIEKLIKVMYPLVNLGDKTVLVLEIINLAIVLGEEGYEREIYVEL